MRQQDVFNPGMPGVGGHAGRGNRIGINTRAVARNGGVAGSLAPLKRVNKSAPSTSMQHAQLAHENGGIISHVDSFPLHQSPMLDPSN